MSAEHASVALGLAGLLLALIWLALWLVKVVIAHLIITWAQRRTSRWGRRQRRTE